MELVVIVVLMVGLILSIGLWFIVMTSIHAYRRGYQPVVWALGAICAVNPIYLFIVLGLVPHRRRIAMREDFAAQLDAKLGNARPRAKRRTGVSLTDATKSVGANPKAVMDATRTFGEKGTGEPPT